MSARLIDHVIGRSRGAFENAVTAMRMTWQSPSAARERPSVGLRLGSLEDRLLLSATPVDPALLLGAEHADASASAVGAVTVVPESDESAQQAKASSALNVPFDQASMGHEFEPAEWQDDASLGLPLEEPQAEPGLAGNLDGEQTLADTNDSWGFILTADESVEAVPGDIEASTSNSPSPSFVSTSSDEDVSAADQQQTVEWVFVDTGAEDYQQLVDDLLADSDPARQFEIVYLDAEQDGIQQISDALRGQSGIDAIHFVTHGTDYAVKLGDTWLHVDNLDGHAGDIAAWGSALDSDADLLFYGCDLAGGEEGRALLEAMQQLTSADIAASVDDTGHALLGGNWLLEYSLGDVDTAVAFSDDLQQTWNGLLNTFTVTNTNDAGAGSLRQAILDANALAGSDTIQFNIALTDPGHVYYQDDGVVGSLTTVVSTLLDDESIPDFDPDYPGVPYSWYTIQLNSALPTITDTVVIDATTQLGYTGAPIIELDGSSAGASADGLDITNADNTILRGLIINRFGASGIEVSNSDSVIIEGNMIGTDASGTDDLGNGWSGIYLLSGSSEARIGGTSAAQRNVISGNSNHGIFLVDAGTSNNDIQGNYIGTDVTGTVDLGNDNDGVHISLGASFNVIGGTSAGAANVISGNNDEGIEVSGSTSTDNRIEGNLIGTASDGVSPLGNQNEGIWIEDAPNTTIGGVGAGNIIAEGQSGIIISGDDATNTVVQGNFIGTDTTGTADLGGTYYGIVFWNTDDTTMAPSIGNPTNAMIGGTNPGEGNVIANFANDGVHVAYGTGHTIRGNSIYGNGGLGINLGLSAGVTPNDTDDVDSGPNEGQNFPDLSSAVVSGTDLLVSSSLHSASNTAFEIDFYASPSGDGSGHGEAQTYLGSATVVTDGNGNATINETLAGVNVAADEVITATATDPSGNTSEFGTNVAAVESSALLWLSTKDDVSSSGAPGLDNWTDGQIIHLGDPNLNFGLSTDGTFSSVVNFDAMGDGDVNIDAIHYVGTNITVGSTNSVALQAGDLLLSTDGDEDLTGSDSSTLSVTKHDVFVFRPDVAGDYSSGTFTFLLEGNGNNGSSIQKEVRGISLVETNTTVGNGADAVTLEAGTFLIAMDGGGSYDRHIWHFNPTNVGYMSTTGDMNILIDGDDLDLDHEVVGIELVENDLNLNGQSLTAGQILVTISGNDNDVGNNRLVTEEQDIFVLDITATGAGNTTGTAQMFLDGSDVNLDSGHEEIDGLALRSKAMSTNAPPTDITINDNTVAENTDTTGGYSVGLLSSTDPDGGEAFTYSIVGGPDFANFTIGGPQSDELFIDDGVLDFETKATYRVIVRTTDSAGNTYDELQAISVTNVNENPVAADDSVSTNEDTPLVINAATLLANDSDVDLDTLTIAGFTQPANGSVVDNGDGTFTYSPDPNYNGPDSFTYTADDGNDGTDSATVNITVHPVNDAPVAKPDILSASFNTPLTIGSTSLLTNDSDVDLDALAMASFSQPANGKLIDNGDGTLTYVSNPGFTGQDYFFYTATDGSAQSDVVKVTLVVRQDIVLPPIPDISEEDPTRDSGDNADDEEETTLPGVPTVGEPPDEDTFEFVSSEVRRLHQERQASIARVELERRQAGADVNIDPIPFISFSTADGELRGTNTRREADEHCNDETDQLHFVVETGALWQDLDELKELMESGPELQTIVVEAALMGSVSLTAGYVIWVLRGAVLMSTVLAQLPAWQFFDPLPVLDQAELPGDSDEPLDDGESLDSILQRSAARVTVLTS